jgi:hypothetical protein
MNTHILTSRFGRMGFVIAIVAAAFVVVNAQTAKPAKPAKNALPPAVEAAFKKAYPNATIKNVSKEKEDGVEQYEIESIDGGLSRDLNYKPDGTLISYEEQIAASAVPEAVVNAIKAKYPKATFSTTEKLFKDGTVTYEIGLKGAKVNEVTLTADGKWVSPK